MNADNMSTVVGRESELAAVRDFLERIADGPAMLVLTGEPGIGKTTVWRAGVEAAVDRGCTVLRCRPAVSDFRLSHASLADLLAEVAPAHFDPLPDPQRRALDAALLRTAAADSSPDPRAVAAGLLSVINALSRDAPVIVAIDDFQWLDAPSRDAIEFAARRCHGSVGVLIAERASEATQGAAALMPRDPERRHVVALGPLSLGALHHVIRQGTGRSIARPQLVRIAEASGGNPLFALELARGLGDGPAAALAVPDSLQEAVSDPLDLIAPAVRDALRIVAALASPHVDQVARALDDTDAAASTVHLAHGH